MEYSLKQIQLETKQAILNNPQVYDEYINIYEAMHNVAKLRGTEHGFSVDHIADEKKMWSINMAIQAIKLDGFKVREKFLPKFHNYIIYWGDNEANN